MSTSKQKLLTNSIKKFLSATVAITILATASTGATANSSWKGNDKIKSPQQLLDWQERMSRSDEKERENLLSRDIKLQAMHNYAKTVAIRAAMSSRLDEMAGDVSHHSRELDAIYNFSPLMIQQRVVPPVITEARDLYNQDGNLQIRLSDAIFNIEEQAYFSSTPPNWRTYLNFNNTGNAYEKLSYVTGDMKPSNKLEEEVWVDGTVEGWNLGLRQANVVLEQALNRLNRDYIGMVRFHEMVLQGKVTMPSISNYNLYDNNEGDRLILGEELLQIDVLPTFNDQRAFNRVGGSPATRQLSMAGARIQTPQALDKEPTKEVYNVVEKIRNGQDITDKPWKDALPLGQTSNPLERPVYINVNKTQVLKPQVINNPPQDDQFSQLTQEQINNIELIEEPVAQEERLRRYEEPLPSVNAEQPVTQGMFQVENAQPRSSMRSRMEQEQAEQAKQHRLLQSQAQNHKRQKPLFQTEDTNPTVTSNKNMTPTSNSQIITEGSTDSLSISIKRTSMGRSAASQAFSYGNGLDEPTSSTPQAVPDINSD
ncbi:type IV secretory system conjugative DNA transfer family protein [Psychrobacter sp. AOP31-A1-22]|uniref:type IV secretory system conjugative DNA transfer family protein n=1 Tax=Psychrobacter sp. AOP31-A1-22 TaxID=3457696 RepID=UPI004036872A